MKLTKYEHACFSLETDGKLVVVDPGAYTSDLPALENVVAIVVTHEHPDHYDVNALGALIAHNPTAVVLAHRDITRQFGDTLPHQAVSAGDTVTLDPFVLEFFGGEHAIIHSTLAPVANLGVMINGSVYYPGDSFTLPEKPVEWLALPVAAPWLKMSEAVDFATTVNPTHIFPTHDAVASDFGKQLPDRMLPQLTGIDYRRIVEPIEIGEQ